ncbi:MAG TPA: hypothetical protein VLD35_15995 [Caldimonas sp.]|nr:hypothetical protein [Caldimonas sp.]
MNVPTGLTELMHAVLDGEASESETRELELRLAADPAARAEFEEWQGLFQALREMPKEHVPEGLVAAVSAALPAAPASLGATDQPFSPRRVLGYTSTRTPGSRRGDGRAIQSPTPLRSLSMSQQSSRFFASRKGWLGAGIAAAAVVVVAQLGFDFPVAKDVMGTVAPAQRYRAAPNGSEDVKLAPTATPGAAIGTAPDANRAVAERTDAQLTAERNQTQMAAERGQVQMSADRKAQMTAERTTDAQLTADRKAQMTAERTTDAQMTADRKAQMTAERATDAQLTADRKAQMTAERSAAEMKAQRTEAGRLEAQRAMEKSTNRMAQP